MSLDSSTNQAFEFNCGGLNNRALSHEKFVNMAGLKEKHVILLFSAFLSAFYLTSAVEEVVVIHAPESVKFLSSEPVRSSYLGDIFSAMLSYTIRSNIEWHSLAAVTPWKRPEALVILELLGFDNKIDLPLDGSKFLLENVGDLSGQYDLPAHRTNERFFGKSPIMLHMDFGDELHDSKIAQPVLLKSLPADPKKRLELALSDPELGQLIKESTFNVSFPSDVQLLTELATIKEFLKALSAHKAEIRDGVPDIYWLKIGGLEPIVSTYGPDSFQFREALRLLRQMISEVEGTVRNIYNDNVVVAVIKANTIPLSLGHRGRRLLESTELSYRLRLFRVHLVLF
ncbi:renin receptor-like isoform X2 [Stegodyphus dumicola]|uniref:renin receptor-like isoform X2 n=1 Tax=Stegodyphus dumicola TaxID=202533 RepID=UPI0015B0CA9A|nr:renin receptor-like isoform X2 [Stegodyphus dumicola]